MNYFTKELLIKAVGDATELIELRRNNESSVIVSQYGGRPLGIFPQEDCKSLLWINPHIRHTIESQERDIGGDRYWISPERYYFYKDPENWADWFCPPGLDPADYQILGIKKDACSLTSSIYVNNMLKKVRFNGEVTRQFTLIPEPKNIGGIAYCGIEYVDDCVFFASNLQMNGWSLANIISGGSENPGTVIIPVKKDAKPISYFREIPDDRLRVEDDYVAYKIDVNDVYKLAIRPDDIDFSKPARIGYVLKVPGTDQYSFLLKQSMDVPKTQKECYDTARDHPDAEIGVIQSYNSESPHKPELRYGEIELQLNKFETIENTSHGKATHQLLAYLGSKDEIIDVVEKNLAVSHPLFF